MHAELRPSFQIDLPGATVHETVARLRSSLDATPAVVTEWAQTHVLLALPPRDRHLWSPWLHVDIRPPESEPTGCSIFARFSPHPALWTGIALTYLALASLILFGSCFAVAQMLLTEAAWAWWVVGAAIALAAAIWYASQVGQRLAWDQMRTLRDILEHALNTPSA